MALTTSEEVKRDVIKYTTFPNGLEWIWKGEKRSSFSSPFISVAFVGTLLVLVVAVVCDVVVEGWVDRTDVARRAVRKSKAR